MKKIFIGFTAFSIILMGSTNLFAGHHESNEVLEPFNMQVQMCKLNEGVTIEKYDQMISEYVEWSRKNDVDLYFARQEPIFTHNNFGNTPEYDFLEILASPHKVAGQGWDKWLGTKDGQKLNKKWQSLATCFVKMGNAYPVYLDEKELNSDDNRVATWNWCSVNEGVKAEDVFAQHDIRAKEVAKNPNGLIGWIALSPRIGTANAPGEFAHIGFYSDIEAKMQYEDDFANGGWKSYRDYNENFATCSGEALMSDVVINRADD